MFEKIPNKHLKGEGGDNKQTEHFDKIVHLILFIKRLCTSNHHFLLSTVTVCLIFSRQSCVFLISQAK